MRRRNPEYGEWFGTHAVRFNSDGTVSLMTERQSNPKRGIRVRIPGEILSRLDDVNYDYGGKEFWSELTPDQQDYVQDEAKHLIGLIQSGESWYGHDAEGRRAARKDLREAQEFLKRISENPIANPPAVTDRALRYRANANPPPGPRVCNFCGSRRNVEIGHLDGFEEHNNPENLVWTCRRCNTRMGIEYARRGKGRRTRQYNAGVPTYGQYVFGVAQHVRGAHDEGGKIIHATPPAVRREYARRIWAERRSRGTTSTRRRGYEDEVPF
jgi:hypothetical protein